jgi:hypothetical protein
MLLLALLPLVFQLGGEQLNTGIQGIPFLQKGIGLALPLPLLLPMCQPCSLGRRMLRLQPTCALVRRR